MSRTIKEIYNEAVQERNRRLELTEFASDSKLSVMNGILWTVAAVIYSFETLLDVFAVDISEAINNRINGTPDYYANALLQYQQGDELTARTDWLSGMPRSMRPNASLRRSPMWRARTTATSTASWY